ncbi:reverse transcriptase (RNA-dependent DNA polymerase) domain-containing protein [Phthorimaea operculella]|nr:reverse transcriptase (RNA-dependent DNA polymerase) domain-containing protein [Phthorimaea operculella]
MCGSVVDVGAQQGDPLGPLIFSLAIHKSITSLKSTLNIWYLDDGTIGGTVSEVADDIQRLFPKLKEVGLEVNTGKCEIYPCGTEAARECARFDTLIPGIKVLNRDNLSLLGAPIFLEAIPEFFLRKRNALEKAHQEMRHLSAHVALILLRSCLSLLKLTYTIRTCPTWMFPQDTTAIDEVIKTSLEEVLNISLSDRERQQASLPVRHGDLGVRRVQETGPAAFLASANGVLKLVTQIFSVNGAGFSIPFASEAFTAWTAACPNTPLPTKPDVQRLWDDPCAKDAIQKLIDTSSGADLARLKAACCHESGAWLNALPSPHLGTYLDNNSLRIAVALRLGCKVCEPHLCRCGTMIDDRSPHGLSCRLRAGRHPRHHARNDLIRRALMSVDVPCVLEPPGLSRADGKRPDGLTLIPWKRGRSLLWDATCACTFAATHLPRIMRTAGLAAEFLAKQKTEKYAGLCQSYDFVPFAVETSGVWCAAARTFAMEIGQRLKACGRDPRAGSYLVQQISLTIQRGNAASVMGTFGPGPNRHELLVTPWNKRTFLLRSRRSSGILEMDLKLSHVE